MAGDLFDMHARALRRDRAFASGPVLFLHERAFADILERLAMITRQFSTALLIGSPDPAWPARLARIADTVVTVDPGAMFAKAAGGIQADADKLDLDPASFDLCVAIGTLDTVNDLPGALLRLRLSMKPDSLVIGAMAGGDSLPRLRQAMRAADMVMGSASPHVHPRIEPAGLAQLLTAAGFAMPVVDVDRAKVAYRSFERLVADLRAMGSTNILYARSPRPLSRKARIAGGASFESGGKSKRTIEIFEILHFAAWTPADPTPAVRG